MKNDVQNTKPVQITPEMERKMREIANLMWDRMFEDKKKGALKFKPVKKRVITNENTT